MQMAFPPEGINYVQQYLSCNKCHAKVMDSPKKIIKCSECGLTQLKSKCSSKIIASILTKTDKDTMSLRFRKKGTVDYKNGRKLKLRKAVKKEPFNQFLEGETSLPLQKRGLKKVE